MLSEEDVQKAKEAQIEYWANVEKRMEFFLKKTEVTDDIIHNVFTLPNYSIYQHWFEYCVKARNSGYDDLSRFWASEYISYHLNFLWLPDYDEARKTLDERKSNKAADDARTMRRNEFKKLYP